MHARDLKLGVGVFGIQQVTGSWWKLADSILDYIFRVHDARPPEISGFLTRGLLSLSVAVTVTYLGRLAAIVTSVIVKTRFVSGALN